MSLVEGKLKIISKNLISITRNTVKGWYELEIGIPSSWAFNGNEGIDCDIISENDAGKLLKISPKNKNVIVDDLMLFVRRIIETNEEIAEKEKIFTRRMEDMKKKLEKEAEKFYNDLEKLKKTSFEAVSDENDNEEIEENTEEVTSPPKKRGRPTTKKSESNS